MNIKEYQKTVFELVVDKKTLQELGLGFEQESAKVTNHLKNYSKHGKPIYLPEIMGEIGDSLLYLTAISTMLGIKMEDILLANWVKIKRASSLPTTSDQ
jgi:NTP pyrophosphatase (non-canonical NTP hydrolase)